MYREKTVYQTADGRHFDTIKEAADHAESEFIRIISDGITQTVQSRATAWKVAEWMLTNQRELRAALKFIEFGADNDEE